jgi:transcription elongation factor GreA
VETQTVTVDAAVEQFIAGCGTLESAAQAELRRFERWIGKNKKMSGVGPLDIERYGEKQSVSDPEYAHKLEVMRKFLAYARDSGWTSGNLAVHLKAKKGGRTKASGVTRTVPADLAMLTRQGYDDIVKELAGLKAQRPGVLEEIRRAAADKDFRENAPLHAAREQLGHIDGRIEELTAIIKSATIIGDGAEDRGRVSVGQTIKLKEIASGQIMVFTIVGPKEANPAHGKISHVSPIGKAVLGKCPGDTVEVAAPAGARRYCIEEIEKA